MSAAPNLPAEIFNDTALFSAAFLKILDRDDNLIPLRLNKAQRYVLSQRTSRNIILKARQVGITTGIQADFFRQTTTRRRRSITLAHVQDTTDQIRLTVDRFYDNLPEDFRPIRRYSNSRLATYPEFDSTATIATAGNKNIGRGLSVSLFHGTEVAFWPNAESIVAGAMQGGNPEVFLESTPNGAQGYFYNTVMECLDGRSDWRLFFIAWWHDPTYRIPLDPGEVLVYTAEEQELVTRRKLTPEQIKWRRDKQRLLKHLFAQEYPEDERNCFLTSGNGYFGILTDVFVAPFGATFQPDHRYVGGLDFGQTNDPTALSIFDATARVQVAIERIKGVSWATIRDRIKAICDHWHVSKLVGEANSIGTVNIEALAQAGLPIVPFWTTNERKQMIMGSLYETLHASDGAKLLNDDIQRNEFNVFTARQLPSGAWQLAAPDVEGVHDDTVIATALSYYAALGGGSYTGAW